ncbi:DUF6602 domain-containing protein [Haliangium sp.]|uniref:DUF6602 domain-containing protein n=1 Tax=Haliangium sp. TaxID=2663208 RepID=UPI003D111984
MSKDVSSPTNKAKRALAQDGPRALQAMYEAEQQKLIAEMKLTDAITHDGTKGHVGEQRWIGLFDRYLPTRFKAQSGIVIDHTGATSDQIDIVIHDRHYTPPILGQGSHVYILAEAVYAVFEIKQAASAETMADAGDKIASVRGLERTSVPMINSGQRLPARKLFTIIGGLLTRTASWSEGLGSESFEAAWGLHAGDDQRRIDCGVALEHGCFDCFPTNQWEPPDAKPRRLVVHGPEAGLIYFLFRLLGRLNTIGTVPAVDWDTYATVFGPPRDERA